MVTLDMSTSNFKFFPFGVQQNQDALSGAWPQAREEQTRPGRNAAVQRELTEQEGWGGPRFRSCLQSWLRGISATWTQAPKA